MSRLKSLQDLIYLVGCVVNDATPQRERVEAMDLNALFSLAKSHSLLVITLAAVKRAFGGVLPEDATLQQVEEQGYIAKCQNIMVNEEMRQLLDFLESEGIWYMPLKGALLQYIYPSPEMREMGDRDILFDSGYQRQVYQWFKSHGYTTDFYKKGYHDEYTKAPFFLFEMHTFLFTDEYGTPWAAYYEDVKSRLLPDEGKKYGYHFSDDDFFIHLITHGYKHYTKAGNGISFLLDCYLFLKKKGAGLDWQYIKNELASLGIDGFEEKVRSLSQSLFSAPEELALEMLSQEEVAFLNSFAKSGKFGNLETMLRNNLKNHNATEKLKYLWRRLFPKVEFFKYSYPFFYRHKWLLPVGYAYRIVGRSLVSHKRFATETRALIKL